MIDFAKPGRTELIFFEPGDKVRWHENNGKGPFVRAEVMRTAVKRVWIILEDGKCFPVPNLHLSHDPIMSKDGSE